MPGMAEVEQLLNQPTVIDLAATVRLLGIRKSANEDGSKMIEFRNLKLSARVTCLLLLAAAFPCSVLAQDIPACR